MSGKRICYFDNIKCILMFLVLFAHGLEIIHMGWFGTAVYKLIYLFHMPAFVMLSGYLSKKGTNKTTMTAMGIEYMVFQTIYLLFDIYCLGGDVKFGYTTPYWILWYLFALIAWRALINYTGRYSIVIAVIFAILCGYKSNIGHFISLSRIIVFFPFFILGYNLHISHFKLIKQKINPIFAIAVFIISLIALTKLKVLKYSFLYYSYSYSATGIKEWYAGAIRLGVMVWGAILVAMFLALVPHKKMWCTKLGQNTMTLYIMHGFAIKGLGALGIKEYVSGVYGYAIYFVGIVALYLILLSRPVNVAFNFVFIKPIKLLANFIIGEKNDSF